jgi:hypothetical protein
MGNSIISLPKENRQQQKGKKNKKEKSFALFALFAIFVVPGFYRGCLLSKPRRLRNTLNQGTFAYLACFAV